MGSPVLETFTSNYGEHYRYGKTISATFAESTVNEVVSVSKRAW